MRKLSLLVIGLAIIYYGFDVIADATVIAPYVLRDGLIVAVIGAILFVAKSAMPPSVRTEFGQSWPAPGQLLVVGAVASTVMAAIFLAVTSLSWLGVVFWGIGVLLLLVGAAWPGVTESYGLPAYRWRVDAAGRFVRTALQRSDAGHTAPLPLRIKLVLVALFVVVLCIGAWLRLWELTSRPPDCIGVECGLAMQILTASGETAAAAIAVTDSGGFLFSLLTRVALLYTGEPLAGLRWASALAGLVTLPIFYLLARAFTTMGGAALATVLLTCSPWHIWISRTNGVAAVTILLLCAAVATGAQAIRTQDRRWWGATGILLGLLAIESAALRGPVLVWLLACAALALATIYRQHERIVDLAAHGFVPLAGGLVVMLPILAVQPIFAGSPGALAGSQATAEPASLGAILTYLLHGGGVAGVDFFLTHGLIGPLAATLSFAGLVYMIRYSERALYMLVLVGVAATVTAIFGAARRDADALAIVPALLPFFYISAAVALDRSVGLFQQVWRPLIIPHRALAGALVLLLVIAGWRALALSGDLGKVADSTRTSVDSAMVRFLAECLPDAPTECVPTAQNPLYFVPPSVLTAPSARLLLGDAQGPDGFPAAVRALDPGRDLLPNAQAGNDRIFLISLENQPLIELLQQLYPTANMQAHPQEAGGEPAPTQFVAIHVPHTEIAARSGLMGTYFTGAEFGAPEDVSVILRTEALDFKWATAPPLAAPFSVEWKGSLLVPQTGNYTFQLLLEPDPANPADATENAADSYLIALQLDGQLVLDTSAGLLQQTLPLIQGVYDISLRYRTDSTTHSWAVQWQTPAGGSEPIPRSVLYSPALPNVGLVGTYYAGDQLQGPALATRKELILDGSADLPSPYSVVWRGKLAATRAGEYLFSITGDGSIQLLLDDQEIVGYLPSPELAAGPDFSQAGVYLNVGWHPIEIRYIPGDQQPDWRLLWQPPGSGPGLLLSRYLLPIQAPLFAADMPLPPGPALLDTRLGNDQFALSQTSSLYQPQQIVRPAGLATLLAEQLWQTAPVCGAASAQLARPHGVAVDSAQGRVYVADTDNQRIVILDMQTGEFVETIADDRLEAPVDIELDTSTPDETTIWILDAVAQTLFALDQEQQITTVLPLPAGFYRPRGMAVNSAGNFLIADTGGARIALLNPAGEVLAQFGSMETPLGKNQPVDALVANDVFWAITAEDGRLWHLETSGSLTVIERANTVDGAHAAALPDGSFFITDPVRRTFFYYAASGRPLAQFIYTDNFRVPTGIAAALVDLGAPEHGDAQEPTSTPDAGSGDASTASAPEEAQEAQDAKQFALVVVADTETCAVSAWRIPLAAETSP